MSAATDNIDRVMQDLKKELEKPDPPQWHPAPDECLLSNCTNDYQIEKYKRAAKVLGIQVRIDKAYDINGKKLSGDYVGIYVKPSTRNREIWDWLGKEPRTRYQILVDTVSHITAKVRNPL